MFGGVVTDLDQWTLNLLTNPTVLAINAHGTTLNKPVPLMAGSSSSCYAWQAQATSNDSASSHPRAFVAIFNTDNANDVDTCRVDFKDVSVVRKGTTKCTTTDVWAASRTAGKLMTKSGDGEISARVRSTDVALLELTECV